MKNGIYCLEGFWFGPKDKRTVYPILDLLKKCEKVDHMYHKCATKDEAAFMIKQWGNKTIQKDYPIIYFACHGSKNSIDFAPKAKISLDDLAEILEGKCERTIFCFGSCDTLNIDERHIKRFLQRTGGLAAIGYKTTVEWMLASSFELLVLSYLHECKLDTKGIKDAITELKNKFGKLARDLKFKMVPNERVHYPRKRKK